MKSLQGTKKAAMRVNFAGYQRIGHGYLYNEKDEKAYCTLFSMPNSQYYKVCIFKTSNIGLNYHSLKEAEENYSLNVRWTEKSFVIEACLPHQLPVNGLAATLAGLIDFKF